MESAPPPPRMPPQVWIGSIVIRSNDVQAQARFWAEALGYERHIDRPDFIVLSPPGGNGPNVSIDAMRAEPQARPRIHLDLYAQNQTTEIDRLVRLGATRIEWDKRPETADYEILADPEGNRFCVIDAGS